MRLKIINIFTLMSNKVSPETTSSYVYNENYNDENKNILRVKPNDNLELGKCKNKCHKCYNSLNYCFDVSIDNIPYGSIFSFFLTIISCFIISTGIDSFNIIIGKYNKSMGEYIIYFIYGLSSFLFTHLIVMIHGISVSSLECSREICHRDEIGCYCGCCRKKETNCGKCCRKCQFLTRFGIQTTWGIIGTILIISLYVIGIFLFLLSSNVTFGSYLMDKGCSTFSVKLDYIKNNTENYLVLAKDHLKIADQTSLNILRKYNDWIDLKKSFEESSIGEISQEYVPTISKEKDDYRNKEEIYDEPNYEKNNQEVMYIWEPESRYAYKGRYLLESESLDPGIEIAKGRSILETLNKTIIESEKQLKYYYKQADKLEIFCYDFGGIKNSLFLVTVGIFIILISHLISFGVHCKYFTAWNYEAKLIKSKIFS